MKVLAEQLRPRTVTEQLIYSLARHPTLKGEREREKRFMELVRAH